jgi:ankyrin repeat protein
MDWRMILAGCLVAAAADVHAAEIHDAARKGDLARVRELIAGEPAQVNSRDRNGSAPLHHAAMSGHLDIVRMLLEQNAEIDLADKQGSTPLHAACMRFQPAVARLLVDRGAKVNVRDQWGHTALANAVSSVFGQDLDLIKLLIAKGADVNAAGTRGETPLHGAASRGDLTVARLLIESGADLNPHASPEGTPLHNAIERNRPAVARFLIERGARLSDRERYGFTALHLAAIRGGTEVTNLLLERGADVHAGDRHGRTALFYAARHGHRAVADILTAAGAKEDGITERNFGKAPQLGASLAGGEAFLWYLGFFAGDGYAVKTGRHLLLFDPPGIDESPEAGLANGSLNPRELEDQHITIFITKPDWERYTLGVLELANRLKDVRVVMAFKPEGRTGGQPIPTYRLAEPGQRFSVGDLQVRTIPATLGGVAYLVESDGLKIFHAGYHVRNSAAQDASYRKEIDSLSAASPIDIALLPTAGHTVEPYTYGAYEYLVDRLAPRAVYLMHGAYGRENYWECAVRLLKRGAHVEFPENEGDRFHLRQGARP